MDDGGGDLAGWRVLITAGGTREPIDPVRYIGNYSSGKMGHELARQGALLGADVFLVTTVAFADHDGVHVVEVETAEEMAAAVWELATVVDVTVMAAAVADFRPKRPADDKLRRKDGPPHIELEPTPDVLAGVVERVHDSFIVGFAAETGSLQRAIEKARTKGVDLLVANDVSRPDSGFGSDTNAVSLIWPDGSLEEWSVMPKSELAARLWQRILEHRAEAE